MTRVKLLIAAGESQALICENLSSSMAIKNLAQFKNKKGEKTCLDHKN
jgi:hypothetical protein